jgi:cystinosin
MLRECYECHEQKPKAQFPKRQWEMKNRRCFNCFSGNVPFSYNPGTSPIKSNNLEEQFDMHAKGVADESELPEGHRIENTNPRPPSVLSTDRSKASSSVPSRRSEPPSEQRKTAAKAKVESTSKAEEGLRDPKLLLKSRNRFPLRKVPTHEHGNSGKTPKSSTGTRNDPSKSVEVGQIVDPVTGRDDHGTNRAPLRKLPTNDQKTYGKTTVPSTTELKNDPSHSSVEVSQIGDPEMGLRDNRENPRPDVEIADPAPTTDPAPELVPTDESESSGSDSTVRRCCSCRNFLFLFAAPLWDETGSIASVVAGMFTLFAVGSAIGIVSHKNPSLPTIWAQYASAIMGYIYFICWSISFYPQVISNFRRKTTVGLSADFCVLNVIGFGAYTAYNASMFWSSAIRELYREKYHSEVTVQSNDVAFAIHALVLSTVTLAQIIYYRGSERPSKIIVVVIVLILALCAAFPILVLYFKMYSWLDYLYMLSYVKIAISLIKYMPQVVLNYRRKSTAGWSIWNILLDFTGGLLSDLQLVGDCWAMNDFSGITGNLAKFGLGFVSMFFDIVFMTQHYILYSESSRERGDPRRPESEPLLSARDREEHEQQTIDAGDEHESV